MGKKKNKKSDVFKQAGVIVSTILDSCRVASPEDIEESVKGVVMGNLIDIPDRSKVVSDHSSVYNHRIIVNKPMLIAMDELIMGSRYNELIDTPTIVAVIPSNKAHKVFKHDDVKMFDLRGSSFRAVYKEVENRWLTLLDESAENTTNILFIPNIKVRHHLGRFGFTDAYNVNFLILAVPSENNHQTTDENVQYYTSLDKHSEEYVQRIISDVMAAAIKNNLKNLLITPFVQLDVFDDYSRESAIIWCKIVSNPPCDTAVPHITFVVDDYTEFIIFNSAFYKNGEG